MKKPFKRKISKHRNREIVAYDLETTNIDEGTPSPLYITAYGTALEVSKPIQSIYDLLEILETDFLTIDLNKTRFVAWNGNNYDVYFVAAALLHSKNYILRPYLTKSKSLRGLKVVSREDEKIYWEFLDGMSMTGIMRPLKSFLKTFAPGFEKLDLDFSKESFNPKNKNHVRYAERDSEGLYYAMLKANEIVKDAVGVPLQPTIGNLGIKAFARYIPEDVLIWEPPISALGVIRKQVMRGGYCHLMRKHAGPVWKYDINQAYAAAMRETPLPSGRCIWTRTYEPGACGIYHISAKNKKGMIPFYYKTETGISKFESKEISDTWITSLEYEQLKNEGWKIEIKSGYFWSDSFSMVEYVDTLEQLRCSALDGPNGAQGLMMKAIGNNSYGKTVESLDGVELLLSIEQPGDEYRLYQAENDSLEHVWFKMSEPLLREYHQPQIGAFITAHVRMVVRRAALQNPAAFIYADTDCVVFSEFVSLDVDAKRYGAWKIESVGADYRFIAKKVYASFGADEKHAKGMNIKNLTDDDFINWYHGVVPVQKQLHKNNFIKCMTGSNMFITRERKGTKVI